MSTNRTHIPRPPEAVFAVLSDPDNYAHWVVGSSRTRYVEGNWPEVGATFHHTQGAFGIGPRDTTTVLEVDPPRTIKMRVRVRPFVVAEVTLGLSRDGEGTEVTMIEHPVGGLVSKVHNPLFDLGFKLRNAESLRRLGTLACEH